MLAPEYELVSAQTVESLVHVLVSPLPEVYQLSLQYLEFELKLVAITT